VLDRLLRVFVRFCLWLRYRIRLIGLEPLAARGRTGILFLPNHPALIDPIILMSVLQKAFTPRAVADQDEVDIFFIRRLAKRSDALVIPDVGRYGLAGREQITRALDRCVADLEAGRNILLYPAGRLCKSRLEDLGATSAVETILARLPEVRVVLVRMRGMWGSSFSWASGRKPFVGKALKKGILSLLAGGIFFNPRRDVTIEFAEPDDPPWGPGGLPRTADRNTINRYLEAFYNLNPPHHTHVPYTFWRGWRPQQRPEPQWPAIEGDAADVPAPTRQAVCDHLAELTGCERRDISPQSRLARDLGLDSLSRAGLIVWLDKEFGFVCDDPESLHTAGDVMLAACGKAIVTAPVEMKPIPAAWFTETPENARVGPPTGATIAEAFLDRARRTPDRVIIADQIAGTRTYRDVVRGIMALKGPIENLPGERVGIMLPASVAANVVYLAAMFAGKTPVMINWTLGLRNIRHVLDLAGVERILTARALIDRLATQGLDLGGLSGRLEYLQNIVRRLGTLRKLRCWLAGRLRWTSLERAKIDPTAVILFTSGSESLPKAVPLSHRNILANLSDVVRAVALRENDRMIGILPPFHSFGLSGSMLTALCLGLPVVYHPNPTEAQAIGRIIQAYRLTVLLGTPTFLSGIVRASTNEQLATLRMAVTGAEKCSRRVYESLATRCPHAVILEGYGVTECSPFISLNDEKSPTPGTIGKVLGSLEHVVVAAAAGPAGPVRREQRGMLLVRGPSVFAGYLNYQGPSPFVEFDGRTWYRTGDLVFQDAEGVMTFCGRLGRFVKLGGEMISLPAIEAVLQELFQPDGTEKPTLAVSAAEDTDPPELVLFTTLDVGRSAVNEQIRAAGLSGLHTICRVIRLDEIPILPAGKIDYRALKKILNNQ
jgi:long-chain-fatty-acid--[acyl-carrier-protein] ligase